MHKCRLDASALSNKLFRTSQLYTLARTTENVYTLYMRTRAFAHTHIHNFLASARLAHTNRGPTRTAPYAGARSFERPAVSAAAARPSCPSSSASSNSTATRIGRPALCVRVCERASKRVEDQTGRAAAQREREKVLPGAVKVEKVGEEERKRRRSRRRSRRQRLYCAPGGE